MTRPPGEGRARPVVTDGGPWVGKPPYDTVENWVAHIARLSTPVREFGPDGGFLPWISPDSRSGQNDSTGVSGAAVRRDGSARTGTPDVRHRPPDVTPRPGSPSGSVPSLGTG